MLWPWVDIRLGTQPGDKLNGSEVLKDGIRDHLSVNVLCVIVACIQCDLTSERENSLIDHAMAGRSRLRIEAVESLKE